MGKIEGGVNVVKGGVNVVKRGVNLVIALKNCRENTISAGSAEYGPLREIPEQRSLQWLLLIGRSSRCVTQPLSQPDLPCAQA